MGIYDSIEIDKKVAFDIDEINPGCYTHSGALSFKVTIVFLLTINANVFSTIGKTGNTKGLRLTMILRSKSCQ